MNPEQIHFYETAEEMLDQEELDGVLVGTNCNTHTHFAKMVMDRNLPLFLEKPVAVSRKELKTLMKCDAKEHAPVVISFPLRVTKLIREVKKLLDVDVITYLVGEKPVEVCAMKSKQIFKGDMPEKLRCSQCDRTVECMESTYNIVKTRNDTPRSDYCCYAKDTGNEDSGSMLIRYESGMHAVYSQNFFARKGAARRGARLYGYKGTLEYNFVSDEIKVYDHMSDQVTVIHMNGSANGHGGGDFQLVQNFVNLISGKDTVSVAPLCSGIESASVCMAAKESSEQNAFRKVFE